MRNKKRLFFPGQEKGEKVIFFTRRHPLSFLGMFLFAFFMTVLPFLVYWVVSARGVVELDPTGQKVMIALSGAYLLFVLGFFLAAWIDYYLDIMIVTDSRIVDIAQNVLFSRDVAEANLTDIEDVNAEVRGILPTFFHFGTVFVQTAGTARNFEFKSMPDPYGISRMIVDLHQKSLLKEEKREAREIGESIASRRENDKKEEPKPEIKKSANSSEEQLDLPADATRQQSNSLGGLQAGGPATTPPKVEGIEAGLGGEDNNSVSHDDLKKGGGADF